MRTERCAFTFISWLQFGQSFTAHIPFMLTHRKPLRSRNRRVRSDKPTARQTVQPAWTPGVSRKEFNHKPCRAVQNTLHREQEDSLAACDPSRPSRSKQDQQIRQGEIDLGRVAVRVVLHRCPKRQLLSACRNNSRRQEQPHRPTLSPALTATAKRSPVGRRMPSDLLAEPDRYPAANNRAQNRLALLSLLSDTAPQLRQAARQSIRRSRCKKSRTSPSRAAALSSRMRQFP